MRWADVLPSEETGFQSQVLHLQEVLNRVTKPLQAQRVVQILKLCIQSVSQILQSLWLVFIPIYETNVQHLWHIALHRVVPHILTITACVNLSPRLHSYLVRFLPVASAVVLLTVPLVPLRRPCGTFHVCE
jgi:hypothetical protein